MGTVFNSKVFKGVSVAGKIVKGMAKNGLVFWKVQVPTDYILAYDFNGNTADASVNELNGVMTGDVAFEVGRKAGTQSLKFTNGCVKTILPIPINSDKVTIAFWMKTAKTTVAIVAEMSSNNNSNNAFMAALNNVSNSGKLGVYERVSSNYNNAEISNANNNTWKHIVAVIDRSKNATDGILIYVNGTLSPITKESTFDNNGNFVNNILFIGQRNASSLPFVGNLQDFKVYNRVLSKDEITALYNE